MQQIITDIGCSQNSWNGNYCDGTNGTTAYQRVLAFQGSQDCSWKNCIAQVSQPSVVDIEFNETTKICSATQSCNNKAGAGMSNNIRDNDGNLIQNPYLASNYTHTGGSTNEFPVCESSTPCPLGNKCADFTLNTITGVIENQARWTASGSGAALTCTETINPPPPKQGQPWSGQLTRQSCYAANCSGNDCCLGGWEWDANSMKCFQPQNSGAEYGNCTGAGCSAESGYCGPTYYAHCHGHKCEFCNCHGTNCESGPAYGTDGVSNGRNNNNPITQAAHIAHDRPYCTCPGSSWGDFKTTNFEIDASDSYACTIGEDHSGCTAVYP
jgi:hypothetical protein